uniref:Uncharacterized protein n=1 Tax=Micrurus spixii TaxID=129469 RepID=A0A2D4M9V7_9SAUR
MAVHKNAVFPTKFKGTVFQKCHQNHSWWAAAQQNQNMEHFLGPRIWLKQNVEGLLVKAGGLPVTRLLFPWAVSQSPHQTSSPPLVTITACVLVFFLPLSLPA